MGKNSVALDQTVPTGAGLSVYIHCQEGPLYAWRGHTLKFPNYCISFSENRFSGSTVGRVVEFMTRDRGAAGSSLTGVTACVLEQKFPKYYISFFEDRFQGAQWLSGRMLDSKPRVRASTASLC